MHNADGGHESEANLNIETGQKQDLQTMTVKMLEELTGSSGSICVDIHSRTGQDRRADRHPSKPMRDSVKMAQSGELHWA